MARQLSSYLMSGDVDLVNDDLWIVMYSGYDGWLNIFDVPAPRRMSNTVPLGARSQAEFNSAEQNPAYGSEFNPHYTYVPRGVPIQMEATRLLMSGFKGPRNAFNSPSTLADSGRHPGTYDPVPTGPFAIPDVGVIYRATDGLILTAQQYAFDDLAYVPPVDQNYFGGRAGDARNANYAAVLADGTFMSNSGFYGVTTLAKRQFLRGELDWTTRNWSVGLIDADFDLMANYRLPYDIFTVPESGGTFYEVDQLDPEIAMSRATYMDAIDPDFILARAVLPNRRVTDRGAGAADEVVLTPAPGKNVRYTVIFDDTGNPATSMILGFGFYYDQAVSQFRTKPTTDPIHVDGSKGIVWFGDLYYRTTSTHIAYPLGATELA